MTPNKKLNSGPLPQYQALRQFQRGSYIHFFYEVGSQRHALGWGHSSLGPTHPPLLADSDMLCGRRTGLCPCLLHGSGSRTRVVLSSRESRAASDVNHIFTVCLSVCCDDRLCTQTTEASSAHDFGHR